MGGKKEREIEGKTGRVSPKVRVPTELLTAR